MPCYQVNTMSVDFGVADKDLLKEALTTLNITHKIEIGGQVTITVPYTNRTITLDGQTATLASADQGFLNKIKKAYSRATVYEAARVHRMTVVEDDDDPDQLTLRTYAV